MKISEYRKIISRSKKKSGGSTVTKKKAPAKSKGANKTEEAFNRDVLNGAGRFEAISFKIAGGHRYTPDFIVVSPDAIEAYEVKGAYKFPSEGRARLAFDDARERYPSIKFYWMRKTPNGWCDET
jgi:hypothetical protein